MEFNKRYDYLYKQMIAQLPLTGMAWLRPDFTKWWERLGNVVDKDLKSLEYEVLKELEKAKAISEGEMVRIWSDYQVNKITQNKKVNCQFCGKLIHWNKAHICDGNSRKEA